MPRRPRGAVIGGIRSCADGAPRSLLVGVHRDDRLVYVGRVGTGFGQQAVKLLLPRLKAMKASDNPFTGDEAPRAQPDVRWVKPELVAEIEFAGWTGSGMVRQAAFKGLREDKPAREVQAEKPSKLTRSDVKPLLGADKPQDLIPRRAGRRSRPAAATPDNGRSDHEGGTVRGVRISTPDKSLWPDAGDGRPVSKLDLARYFESVGG